MSDRTDGKVRIVDGALPEGFVPPHLSVTRFDSPLRCSEDDCRPGRGGLHDPRRTDPTANVPVDREAVRRAMWSLESDLSVADERWGARDAVDDQVADCRAVAAQLLAVADEIDAYRASPAYAALPPTTPAWQPNIIP